VQAAFDWISRHYTIDENPGFDLAEDPNAAQQGLYYYLLAMAKTLDLYGARHVVDAAGRSHDWRRELAGRLAALQREDGSWVNAQSERWWEGNAVLATAYALQTLEFCR
jgi:squalene-hopene/tetraprenyl-beta-curcumene cyclase